MKSSGHKVERFALSLAAVEPTSRHVITNRDGPAASFPFVQCYRLFVVYGIMRREHIQRIAPPVDARPGVQRVRCARNAKASPESAVRKGLAAKSEDVWRSAAHHADLLTSR